MTTEELEAEVNRLRGELLAADERTAKLQEKEQEMVRRNVTLNERVRYIAHTLREIRDKLNEIVRDGYDL